MNIDILLNQTGNMIKEVENRFLENNLLLYEENTNRMLISSNKGFNSGNSWVSG